jgi:hypothetical protein
LTDAERAALDQVAALISDGSIRWIGATTVVALDRLGDRWRVDLASQRGAAAIETDRVILATGGYVMPREHSVIEGPRPSGVMTADLVGDALDRGWAPARRAVVVGSGRLAAATAEGLRSAGVEVIRPERGADDTDGGRSGADDSRPDSSGPVAAAARGGVTAVRGQPRLTGVRVGGAWLDADALVLADRIQPATFLLRGLGLGDERPGIPAPVDPSGGLALPGLWAAGTCVSPDVDHDRSLVAGHAVAQAILAELGAPLLSSTLLLPGQDEPLTQGWEIKEELDNAVDAVVDSGDCGTEPTTVVDLSGDEPEILRYGAGDPGRFE